MSQNIHEDLYGREKCIAFKVQLVVSLLLLLSHGRNGNDGRFEIVSTR